MGRRNVFNSMPTKPKVAKLAWAKARQKFGKDPQLLRFDHSVRMWIATSEDGRLHSIEEDVLKGV